MRYSFDCAGDGNFEIVGTGSSSVLCEFPDDPVTGDDTFTVGVRVADDDGGVTTDSVIVTVNNVAPVIDDVQANPTIVNEGGISRITVIATDIGDQNDLLYSFDCNDNGNFEVTPQAANTADCPFPDDSVHRVVVEVIDQDGGVTTGSVQVTVNNVAPIVRVSANPSTIAEGGTSRITVVAIDTGDQGDLLYSFDCLGDGSFNIVDQKASTGDCDYPDDPLGTPDIFTVFVKVDDQEGGVRIGTADVTVNNLPPTISSVVANPQLIESTGGAPSTITITATDVAADTQDLLYSFDCDGNGVFELTQGHPDNDAVCDFTGATLGPHTVNVKVDDQDGGFDTDFVIVVVGLVQTPVIRVPHTASASTNPTFIWDPDTLANFYVLQIATSDDFSSQVRDIRDFAHSGGPGARQVRTLLSLPGQSTALLPGIRYFWRIQGKDSTGSDPRASAFSSPAAFITTGGSVTLTLDIALEGIGGAPTDFLVSLYEATAFRGIEAAPFLLYQRDPVATRTFRGLTGTASGDKRYFTLVLIGVETDYYDITVEADRTLANLVDDVPVDTGGTLDMGMLLAGNAVEDTTGVELASVINALDTSVLMAAFGTSLNQPCPLPLPGADPTDPCETNLVDGDVKEFDPRADFNRDAVIDEADFDILKANYLQFSPVYWVYFPSGGRLIP